MTHIQSTFLIAQWFGHWGLGAGWWIVWLVGIVAFWALVVGAVVWLARGGFSALVHKRADTALEVLDRRLAEGEVSPEDYEKRRAILERS